jgi:ABC-2 type transport system ATP-binding protein
MVTQLHLAIVMAIDVRLLVLDEPTLGLDIIYRKEFYDRLLNEYYDGDCTIIISTHQVEEIETLLSHLVFIKNGRITLDSSMNNLADRYFEVVVDPDKLTAADTLEPIYTRELLGKKSYMFEDVPRQQLEPLGEVLTPTVADLFVAKMKEDHHGG